MRSPVGMVEFDVVKLYPLLQFVDLRLNRRREYTVTGTYRFDESIYWRFEITGTANYPYEEPTLTDLTYPHLHYPDFHMDAIGRCCVEEPFLMHSEAIKGIRIHEYFEHYVVPFYCNLFHAQYFGTYISEWPHGVAGLNAAMQKRYGIEDKSTTFNAMVAILKGEVFTMNSRCFCGEKRISAEHFQLVTNLKKLHPLIWRKLLLEKSPC